MVMLSGTEGGKFVDDIDSDLLLANQTVKEIYEKHGPYQIDEVPESQELGLVTKGAYRLVNDAVYFGQWLPDLKTRTGKGCQVWLDGSLYEG